MNKSRGRKSAASLATPLANPLETPRIRPPDGLTPEQVARFTDIVDSLPASFFSPQQAELVALLVRHQTSTDRLSRWIDRLEKPGDWDFSEDTYIRVLSERRKETASIKSLMTALRLTNQSRYRPEQASARAHEGKKIWE